MYYYEKAQGGLLQSAGDQSGCQFFALPLRVQGRLPSEDFMDHVRHDDAGVDWKAMLSI